MIKAEVLLDLADDLSQHVNGIIARNGGAGNVVQESQLPRAPLLLGKEPGILYSDRNLTCGGYQDVQIALLEDELALRDSWRP